MLICFYRKLKRTSVFLNFKTCTSIINCLTKIKKTKWHILPRLQNIGVPVVLQMIKHMIFFIFVAHKKMIGKESVMIYIDFEQDC